jgi:hypothetical protein
MLWMGEDDKADVDAVVDEVVPPPNANPTWRESLYIRSILLVIARL